MKFLIAFLLVSFVNILDLHSTFLLMPNLEWESNYFANTYPLNFFQFSILLIFGQSFTVFCLVYYFFVNVKFDHGPQSIHGTHLENIMVFFRVNFLAYYSNIFFVRCMRFVSFYYPVLYFFTKFLCLFSNYIAYLVLQCTYKVCTINKAPCFHYDINNLKYPKPINAIIGFLFEEITESKLYFFLSGSSIAYFIMGIFLFFIFLKMELYSSTKNIESVQTPNFLPTT
jgi:hypothetical protein